MDRDIDDQCSGRVETGIFCYSVHVGYLKSYYYTEHDAMHEVLDPVEASQLAGPILPHEHILVDFTSGVVPPPPGQEWLSDAALSMQNLGKIRRYL